MKTTMFSPRQVLILVASVLGIAALACNLNPVLGTSTPHLPTPEVIFTAPEAVIALAADTEENVYVVTVEGNLLKIAPNGKSTQLYTGLERCGFSERNLAVLPNGDVVANNCVDKKDTLIRIDQEGNKTTLTQLEESLTSMASDSAGKLYLGFWTSEGNISLNFQPTTYLGGADDLSGHISMLGQDGQLESLYAGGIPLSLAVSGAGDLYAAIWGQAGRFKPASKEYSMCGPTKHFWIGLSDQAEIEQLAPGQKEVAYGSNAVFSHIAMGKDGPLFAFGKFGEEECGIYQVYPGSNPQRLPLAEDDLQKNITSLAVSDSNLYFSDANGKVYRVGLKNVVSATKVSQVPPETPSTMASNQSLPGPMAKAGHWEGSPSVSFEVTTSGDIRNFKMAATVGTGRCAIEVEEVPVEADGTFVYVSLIKEDNYWPGADRAGLKAENLWPTPVMTDEGPMVEAVHINGKFDSVTLLTGTFKILVCGNTQFLPAEGKGVETWSAEWKGPAEVGEAPVASPTPTMQPPAGTPVPPTNTPMPTPVVTPPPPTPAATIPPAVSAPVAPPSPAGSWQRIADLPRQINALVADPTNPQVLYAGTGSFDAGSGVYKSEDVGLSWRLMVNGLPQEMVNALAFSKDSLPILYAQVGHGEVYASMDGAQSWSQVGVDPHFSCSGCARRMVVSPRDRNQVFIVEAGMAASYSRDGGQNWQAVQDERGVISALSLAVDPADTEVIYLGTEGNGVYKSTDGGETWVAANRGMLDYAINALAVDPARPQTVYAGGDRGELFKTTDGGGSWSDITGKLSLPEHSYVGKVGGIMIDPAAPDTVYLLADGVGLLASYDGGEGWQVLGKPGELNNPRFTAMLIRFDPQLLLILGVEREGGWRYAGD
jgi:photosystem II stability/assembly factor-like uncharacterized protein